MALCAIAFGGNHDNTEDLFQQAIGRLQARQVRLVEFSSVVRSAPMGQDAGTAFQNAVGLFETRLAATEVLKTLHEIEETCGRVRTIHWGPRCLDLDLLFVDQLVIDTSRLVLPHPHLWYRSFVINPLASVAPDWIHPLLSETAAQLAARLNSRPLRLSIRSATDVERWWGLARETVLECTAGTVEVMSTGDSGFATLNITSNAWEDRERSQPRLQETRLIEWMQPTHQDAEMQSASWKQFVRDVCSAIGAT